MFQNTIERIIASKDLIQRFDTLERLTFDSNEINSISSQNITDIIGKLIKCATSDDELGEMHFSDGDVRLYCQNAYLICCHISKIISQKFDVIKDNAKLILPHIITLCGPLLNSINPYWSDKDCNRISEELLLRIGKICGFDDVKTAINQETWLFEASFEMIHPRLAGEAWRKSSMAEYSFIFLIKNANGDLLVKHLDEILPIVLNLTDDVAQRHARNGIRCMHHVLNEVSPSELRYRCRIDVIYDALLRKIHARDPDLLEDLMPCLLLSLRCIETEMMRKRGTRIPKYDECFDTILTSFHLASETSVKRAFAKSLPEFVSHMGIQIIGHMKMVCIVLEYAFETADLITIQYLSKMVIEMVNVAWLRMGTYAEMLIGLFVKTLYSIGNDHWRMSYVSQEHATEAASSIIEAMAQLSVVNKELILETIAVMRSDECLGLQNYASRLQQLV